MLLISAISLLSMPAVANVDARMLQQRQMFQNAETAYSLGRISEYQQLEQQLRDYPLHSYLQYNEIKRNLGANNYKSIHRYLQDYPGTPLASRLQYSWLKSLAQKKQWQTLIDNFYYTSDKSLQCDFARALIAVNQNERAFSVLEGIWPTGKSLPDNCDYPVDAWHKAGGLSQDMAWERIRLTMQDRNPQLALYLSKYLKPEDQFWVRLWAKVRRDPNFVMQVYDRFKSQDTQQLRWVLADGIRRMSIDDAPSAAQLWYEWRDQF
jgi:soluble lytic murein transglycosylase